MKMPFFPPPGSYDTSQAYAELPELFTLHPLSLLWVDELIKRSGDRTLSNWEVGVLCQRNSWTHPSLTQNGKVGESQWRRCRDKSASLLMLVFICLGTVYVWEALTSIHSLRDGVIYWNKAKTNIYLHFKCNYESRFVLHVHHKKTSLCMSTFDAVSNETIVCNIMGLSTFCRQVIKYVMLEARGFLSRCCKCLVFWLSLDWRSCDLAIPDELRPSNQTWENSV